MTNSFEIEGYIPFAHDIPGAGYEGQYPVPLSSFSALAYLGLDHGRPQQDPPCAWSAPPEPGRELELVAYLSACARDSRLNTSISSSCEDDVLRGTGPAAFALLQRHSVRVALAITLAGINQSKPGHMERELNPVKLAPGTRGGISPESEQSLMLRGSGPEARAAAAAGATNIATTVYSDQARPWYVQTAQAAATATIAGYTMYKATRNPYLAVAAGVGTLLLDDETVQDITNLINGDF